MSLLSRTVTANHTGAQFTVSIPKDFADDMELEKKDKLEMHYDPKKKSLSLKKV